MRKAIKQIAVCATLLLVFCLICRLTVFRTYTAYIPLGEGQEADFRREGVQMEVERPEVLQASEPEILYLQQDMRSFELYGTVRAVICVCDSLNYILNEEELAQVFKTVRLYLEPDGVFLFDFNTPEKYEGIGETVISEVRDNAAFIWENYYDEETRSNEYDITFFLEREDGLYERQEEVHCQRAWTAEEVVSLLKEGGLKPAEQFPGYPKEEDGRTVLVCVPADPEKHIY